MTKLEQIRESHRALMSMDANEMYLSFKDSKDKKGQIAILLDQNPRMTRDELLDVLEDLGFAVGWFRKKPKVSDATIAFHQDPEKHEAWAEAEKKARAESKKPFVISQEMLDVANALAARRTELTEILDQINELEARAIDLGICIKQEVRA